jgi:tetratricopeptide (TPR) repeat protein
MTNFLYLKNTYKTILFFVLIIFFFFGYNFFLVDRSLINLKIALAQTAEAKTIDDFQRISSVLKFPIIKEIFSKDISSRQIISLELAENSARTENVEAAKSANFYLKEAVRTKKSGRPRILSFLDDINALFFKPSVKVTEKDLRVKIKSLNSKIESTQNKAVLQELYYEAASVYAQLGSYDLAESALVEVIKLEPAARISYKSRFNLGWIYKITGEFQKALDYFNQLSDDSKGRDQDLFALCQYQIADTYYRAGDYVRARDIYADLVNMHPEFKTTDFGILQAGNISLYNLGDVQAATLFFEAFGLYQQGKDFSFVVKDAIEYIKSNREAGKVGDQKGDIKQPIPTAYSSKVKPVNDIDKLRKIGFDLLKDNKYAEAIVTFRKVLESLPRDGVSYGGLSLGYYWLKIDKQALEEARKAVELAPMDEMTVANAMFIFINSGLPEETIEAGERLIHKRGSVRRPQVYYNLGYAYIMLNKLEEGVTYFRKTVKLDRSFVSAMNNLGAILWIQHKYQEAVMLLSEAIALNPGYADAHYNLGAIYLNTGRMEDSYHEFQLVYDIDPDYKDIKRYMESITNYLKQSK